jgi:DNA-binding NtrC family response regulator
MSEAQATKILLVEDEPDAMAVLHETLLAAGAGEAQYLFAPNGAEALETVRATEVDVIFADVLMPTMSGLQLLDELNALGRYQPFIVVTSLQSRDVAIQAIRLGAFDFLEKPLHKAKIAPALAKALRVSQAYRRLEAEADRSLIASGAADLRHAAREVLKLRAMRHQGKLD